ncbi:MAG TPA: hypothetical protein VF624_03685 [Tepidisphaeraceae bacterium]
MPQLRLPHARSHGLRGQHRVQRLPLRVQIGEADLSVAVLDAGERQITLDHNRIRHLRQHSVGRLGVDRPECEQFLGELRVHRKHVSPPRLRHLLPKLKVRQVAAEHHVAPFEFLQFGSSKPRPDRRQVGHAAIAASPPRCDENMIPHLRAELAFVLTGSNCELLNLRSSQCAVEPF